MEVAHLFGDPKNPVEWTMADVIDKGTPIDDETGEDLKYLGVKTQVINVVIEVWHGAFCDITQVQCDGGYDIETIVVDYDDSDLSKRDLINSVKKDESISNYTRDKILSIINKNYNN